MATTETLRIPIGLDTTDVRTDAEALKKQVEDAFDSSAMQDQNKQLQQVANSMKQTYEQAVELADALDEVNNTQIKTDAYVEIEKRLQKNNDAFDRLLIKQDELMERGITSGKAWDTLNASMEVLGTYIREDTAELQQLVDTGEAFRIDTAKAAELEKKLGVVNDKLKIQLGNYNDIVKKQQESTKEASKLPKEIDKANQAGGLLSGTFKTIAKRLFGITAVIALIRKAFRTIISWGKEGFGNLTKELNKGTVEAQYNTDLLKAKMTQLKNAIGAMIAPLYNKIVPVIAQIADVLTRAFNTASRLVGLLTGNKIVAVARLLGAEEGKKLDEYKNQTKTENKYDKEVEKAQTQYEKELVKYQDKITKAEEKQAKAALKLSKAQEKANKQLAGFDELNNINSKDIDDTVGSLEDYMAGIEMPELKLPEEPEEMFTMFEEAATDDKFPAWLQNVIDGLARLRDRAKELAGISVKGFFDSLGDNYRERIQNITDNVGRIKEAVLNIWNDPELQNSANNYLDSLAYLFGSFAGTLANIGITWMQNLTGGIATWLETDGPWITESLASIFDIWSSINEKFSTFLQDFADIFSVWGEEDGQQITADLLGIFTKPFVFALEYGSKFINDLLSVILDPIHEHKDDIKNAFADTLEWLSGITSFVKGIIDEIIETLEKVYDEHVAPLFETIKEVVNGAFDAIFAVWQDTFKPVIDDIVADFPEIQAAIEPVIEEIGEVIGAFLDFVSASIKAMYDNLKPVFSWIHEHIGPVLKKLLQEGWQVTKTVIKDVMNILKTLFDFVKNVFKLLTDLINGDWDAAWEDCKNIVKDGIKFIEGIIQGLWDFISGIFKGLASMAKEWGGDLVGNIADGITNGINGVENAVGFVADKIHKYLHFSKPDEGPLKDFDKYMPDMMKALADGIKKNMNLVSNMMDTFTNNISKAITGINTSKMGSDLMASLVDGLKSGNISNTMSNIARSIHDSISGIGNQAYSWGTDMMQNLVNGIYDMYRNVVNAVSDVADVIWDYLHFTEPDKGPLKDFHTFMPDMIDNMVHGINQGIPEVENALSQLSLGIAGGTSIPPRMAVDAGRNMSQSSANSFDFGALTSVLSDVLSNGGGFTDDRPIVLQIDGVEVFRAIRKQSNVFSTQTGISAF